MDLHFDGSEEQRLDRVLAQALPQFSRSRLQALIRQGSVQVDGGAASKAGQMIEPGAAIRIQIPEPVQSRLGAENIALKVVYEDESVVVIDKPANMVVHPGSGHSSGTLVNAALAHDPGMLGVGGEQRPGVVHRLDKDTSGLIVLAKSDSALHWLQDQFQTRQVRKTYLALVDGRPPTPSGRVEAAIGRDPSHRKKMAVLPEGRGRDAATEYSTVELFPKHTLLEVRPLTGRTHQVRLHCAFLGCPIAGDVVYGRKRSTIAIDRHFLHAWKLAIVLPLEDRARHFEAALPPELERVLAELRLPTTGAPHDRP